jgi:3-hydroxyanthranilate 3,4-dioxygenase
MWNFMQVICICTLQSPHSPSRSEGSIGLVIERKGQDKAILTVYCGFASCNHKLHEVYFELNDIEKTFPHFTFTSQLRTCEKCGTVMETDHDLSLKSN